MKKLCKFPEIEQYRTIVDGIKYRTQYVGKDLNGIPIYDDTITLPIIKFGGTVKLHGTNAGFTLNKDGEMYPQSRESVLSITEDNAGFALFVEKNKDIIRTLFDNIDFNGYDYITIFGEWIGKGIQKNMAINNLDKSFVIFDIKLSYESNEQGKNLYLPESEIKKLRSVDNNIYNIYDFKTYEIEIDFNKPGESLEVLTKLTMDVENECPVGKSFGFSGIGEGIVWTFQDDDGEKHRFKTKGPKHKGTSSKTKKIVEVDVEKINSVKEFVDYTVTESRLEQGIEKIFGFDKHLDIKKTGDFLRWVVNDIMKEEIDTLIKNGLEPKDVNSSISIKGREWLFEKMKTF